MIKSSSKFDPFAQDKFLDHVMIKLCCQHSKRSDTEKDRGREREREREKEKEREGEREKEGERERERDSQGENLRRTSEANIF